MLILFYCSTKINTCISSIVYLYINLAEYYNAELGQGLHQQLITRVGYTCVEYPISESRSALLKACDIDSIFEYLVVPFPTSDWRIYWRKF